ncbi:MAG: metallophosphoesterase [Nitrospirota bacterium]
MLIGIISDTHDDTTAIRKAVDYFNAEKVSHVLHAGDITSPFTFEIFRDLKCRFTGIFGNNDGDKLLLTEKSGGNVHNQPHFITIGGKKIVLMHEPDLVNALSHSGHFNIVIYGHTHRPDIRNIKETLVINPGKAARLYRGGSTLAILNTAKMEASIVKI